MAIPTLSLNSTTGTISSSSLRSLNFAEKLSSVATSATSSRKKPPSLLADVQPALISSPSEGVHFANRSYASRPAGDCSACCRDPDVSAGEFGESFEGAAAVLGGGG